MLSYVAKLAWPIQIVIFVLLLFFLPHTTYRWLILLVYILVSVILVRYVRKAYA